MVAQTATKIGTDVTASPRPLRIAMFGHFGSGNLGNEGSLEAVLAFLRSSRPDAELSCICVEPAQAAVEHRISAVAMSWRPENPILARMDRMLLRVPGGIIDLFYTLSKVSKYDVIVVPGTGILDDFGAGPMGMPYGVFKWSLLSRLSGVQFWFVSIGAGPINHPLSRWFMKSAARLATFRSFRDRLSQDYMTSIGFDAGRDPVYPDVAFGLPAPDTHVGQQQRNASRMCVGLGVMTYYGWYQSRSQSREEYDRYLGKLTEFAVWLLDQGYDLRLLTGEMSDDIAVNDLLAGLHEARPGLAPDRIVAEYPKSLQELMQQISETDLVVATRFHNIVCALKLGRPAISLGYSKKNDVLLADFGLEQFCDHVEAFDVDWLKQRFGELRDGREQLSAQIIKRLAEVRTSLAEQNNTLAKQLCKRR